MKQDFTNFTDLEVNKDADLIESYATNFIQSYNMEILDAKYDKVTAKECAQQQNHMTEEERDKFEAVLHKYEELCDGKLGLYPHKQFHLTLKPGATQKKNQKPYPVPYKREQMFKK